jgi:hypothetical protein
MRPAAVHTAARMTGREPGQNEHDGGYNELSHLALLGTVGIEMVSTHACCVIDDQSAGARIARPSLLSD